MRTGEKGEKLPLSFERLNCNDSSTRRFKKKPLPIWRLVDSIC